MRKLNHIFFLASIFIITVAFNFQHNPPSNWYQQFLPDIGARQITNIIFIDSLNGLASTSNLSPGDTGYILKTTNGGDNWNFSFTTNRGFSSVKFLNINTGYACGGSGGGTTFLCKTTDSGLNWFSVNSPSAAKWKDMSVLSEDTIWLVDDNSLNGGVYRTTNSGLNWQTQFSAGTSNPDKIYMFNARIGFFTRSGSNFYRTTNGGMNWLSIPTKGFVDIVFTDSLTGWKGYDSVYKTTNSGLNWNSQILPTGGIILTSQITKFSLLNKDTIWGGGGQVFYGAGQFRGLLYRTTNGGINWQWQVPDTSIRSGIYGKLTFVNKRNGWAYWGTGGIHTITGGDTGFITSIKESIAGTPSEFILNQNFPNPFNPKTIISYNLSISSDVKMNTYDLQGKLIASLVNSKEAAGSHLVNFDADKYKLSSGVYFYILEIENSKGSFREAKKMMLVK